MTFHKLQAEIPIRKTGIPNRSNREKLFRIGFIIALLVLLILLSIFIYRMYFRNSGLVLQKIEIQDLSRGLSSKPQGRLPHFSGTDIIKRLESQKIICGKTNLMGIPLPKLRAFFENDPCFEIVEIRKIFPDTLRISIQERSPLAVLLCERHMIFIDQNGIIFPILDTNDVIKYPMILLQKDSLEFMKKRKINFQTEPNLKSILHLLQAQKLFRYRPETGYTIKYLQDRPKQRGILTYVEPYADNRTLVYPPSLHGKKKWPTIMFPLDPKEHEQALEILDAALETKPYEGKTYTQADVSLKHDGVLSVYFR